MGSHGLDTKTTLSVSDITAISPATLLLFAFCSLFFLCLRVLSFSEHAACMRHTLCSLFKMYLGFFWQLRGRKERRLHWILRVREKTKKHNKPYRGLWKERKNHPPHPPAFTDYGGHFRSPFSWPPRRWRIKSHAPSRVITNQTCRDLTLQRSRRPPSPFWELRATRTFPSNLLISLKRKRSGKSRKQSSFWGTPTWRRRSLQWRRWWETRTPSRRKVPTLGLHRKRKGRASTVPQVTYFYWLLCAFNVCTPQGLLLFLQYIVCGWKWHYKIYYSLHLIQ